jgi:hypothetical protein
LTRRHLAAVALAASTTAALLAGCGASSSGASTSNESSAAPKTELTDALHSLTAGSALTTTLSLDTTSANLVHISGEGGSTPLTQEQADLISGAKVVVETTAPSGKTLAQASAAGVNGGAESRITGTSNGTTYFTFVEADKTFYLQVDLKDMLAAAGQSAQYQSMLAQTANLPAFVKAFVAGKFVSMPLSTYSTLESFIRGAVQGNSNVQIPTGPQLKALGEQIGNTILSDLRVARTSTGSTDQLRATGNLRTIGHDVLAAVRAGVPSLAAQINPDDANQAPDQELELDASVTDGALSRVEFDFGQFSPHQKDTLPIAATFAKSAPDIAAPSGAVQVNLQDIIGLFAAAGSSSSSSGGASAVPLPSVQTSTASTSP